ncbi:MAG: glycosyl transferase family 1 [Crocinitomicaceae bacterium]|nr:glycosyl transferase family 1 [Crocinitomicaceae bacterium]|tara:strand:- start:7421 stop:8518 length:1098 start_codon:yes stop_codon:yes gene_type:complete
MKGILLEPFYGGSHKKWADELLSFSGHKIELFTLPANHWKWRMHGAAISFAEQFKGLNDNVDFILATDMLDLATFKGLIPKQYKSTPTFLYMHENQLNYPWSAADEDATKGRDNHYAFINYTSMLAADQVWFNSDYHYKAWFNALPGFLKRFPDRRNVSTIDSIRDKSSVLPIGIDFSRIKSSKRSKNIPPVILWNHRWEYDKNSELFFKTLFKIKERGIKFELIVLGEQSVKSPEIFGLAKERLVSELVHWGFAENNDRYNKLLAKADLVPVTSNQDFFGISAVEAIASGCIPLLPNRLAFPEHLPTELASKLVYNNDSDFEQKLIDQILNPVTIDSDLPEFLNEKYNWGKVAAQFDKAIRNWN